MAAHRNDASSTRPRTHRGPLRVAALLLTAALAGTGITVGFASTSAYAADRTATITLTGITSDTYPTGGNTVWVQPGSSLTLKEAPVSVAANKGALGAIGSLLGAVVTALNPVVDLKARVDLSSVQRGVVTLSGNQSVATPGLAKGVYKITWSFTAVTALGNQIALNGNQLKPLGITFNANNTYFGYIVSDTKSPCGGAQCISLQTPQLSVAPSAPVVGQLPTVTVPGQNVHAGRCAELVRPARVEQRTRARRELHRRHQPLRLPGARLQRSLRRRPEGRWQRRPGRRRERRHPR
jgi:hypothetical protein